MKISDIHQASQNELVRENLRRILARNAVRRGVRWIQAHADNHGWWRNCLNLGKSRVKTACIGEGVLALVFEYREEFADWSHYINEGKITKSFGLRVRELEMFGFLTGIFGPWKPFPKRYPEVALTSQDIDRAWADFLENPPSMWLMPAKHYPPLPEFIWEERVPLGERIRRLKIRILGRFSTSKQTA